MCRFPKRQISPVIQLQQGKVYFMQAIVKEGGGGDHLSVKVKLPSGAEKAPLGGKDVYTGVPRKFGDLSFYDLSQSAITKKMAVCTFYQNA